MSTAPAVGPLRTVIEHDDTTIKSKKGYRLSPGANALIVLKRVAFFDRDQGCLDEQGRQGILSWTAHTALGQDPQLIVDATARRRAALRRLARQGRSVLRLRAVPEWRLAVGLGDKANAHEIGLSLHGTYGWPVIPGTSLKGLAAAWARQCDADDATLRKVFGSPRPPRLGASRGKRQDPARGAVCFLDALPAGEVVPVAKDVLTPHVKPYYDDRMRQQPRGVPPAEHHSPVPVHFLTVAGAFAVDLVGRDQNAVEQAAEWLTAAGDNLGAGAKTAAGYGYLTLAPLTHPRETP